VESAAEVAVGIAIELVMAVVAAGVLYTLWGRIFATPKRQTVLPFQRGVVFMHGHVEKILNPGRYWITPKRTMLLCDMRPKPFQIPTAELLTEDGMAVRISLVGEYRVANPASFLVESSDAFSALYLDLRQALRTAVGEFPSSVFLRENPQLVARVKELLVPRSAQLGIELTQLEVCEAVPCGWLRQPDQ